MRAALMRIYGAMTGQTPGRVRSVRLRWLVVTCVAVGTLAGCGGGSASSGPEGIQQAVWDQYCVHGSQMAAALAAAQNGTLTPSEIVQKLAGIQPDLGSDALAAGTDSKDMESKIQAVADALGRAKVAIDSGTAVGDAAQEIAPASQALPSCK